MSVRPEGKSAKDHWREPTLVMDGRVWTMDGYRYERVYVRVVLGYGTELERVNCKKMFFPFLPYK